MEDIWNREELYAEVWEKPLVKVAAKYDISAVALGKVCQKLQIPLPGRGYWTKKDFGKPVEQIPLPPATNLPTVRRMKDSFTWRKKKEEEIDLKNETDPELVRIASIKNTTVQVKENAPMHKMVLQTRTALKKADVDTRGILIRPRGIPTLDVRVSKALLDRALQIMNSFVLKIEAEGITLVNADDEGRKENILAKVFNQTVPFLIVEKAFQKNKREVKEYSWTRTVYDFEPTGLLEFHVGGYPYGGKSWRDGKTQKLESLLNLFVAELMLEGRRQRIAQEKRHKEELEQVSREKELRQLASLIKEEEDRIKEFELWVKNWSQAKCMRDFIVALEQVWQRQGNDLSPETPHGKKIVWMKEQADRVDPMVQSPPSILDRKKELPTYFY